MIVSASSPRAFKVSFNQHHRSQFACEERNGCMWLIAEYQPTTFFSLRPASATSSGGRTLLIPTPFAIRMALLDAAIRTQGLSKGKQFFSLIKQIRIAIQPANAIIVNKTFTKILRFKEFKVKASQKEAALTQAKADHQWPFQNTISYREYVQFAGKLVLAFEGDKVENLSNLLWQVNYLGKRGGFIQLDNAPYFVHQLPQGFTLLTEGIGQSFPLGVLQVVDDWHEKITFENVDVYHPKGMSGMRIFHQVIIPYRLTKSSRSYDLYERL